MPKIPAEEVSQLKAWGHERYERFLQKQRSYHYQALENRDLSVEEPEPIIQRNVVYLQRVDRKALDLDQRVQGMEKALGNYISSRKQKIYRGIQDA